MSNFSNSSDGRFVSKPSQVLVGQKSQLEGSIAIINAIISSTSSDLARLVKGLVEERIQDAGLDATWRMAEQIYEKESQTNPVYRQSHKEYHVALIVYVLKFWYGKFNEITRTVGSTSDAKNYPYKNYFKILLLAVVHVRGVPAGLPKDAKLYRGISGHISTCQVGSWIAFQHFASTSRDVNTALGYAGQGNRTLFVISGIIPSGADAGHRLGIDGCPNAICLDHIAPHNQECLLWPCEEFLVEKIDKLPDGLHVIYLKA